MCGSTDTTWRDRLKSELIASLRFGFNYWKDEAPAEPHLCCQTLLRAHQKVCHPKELHHGLSRKKFIVNALSFYG